ncbi:MAG: UDP-N-acetylmuramate dehydrogenase [Lachnospiraceae bacterium]
MAVNLEIYEYINRIIPKDNIHQKEPMSRHTTFRVGGTADLLIEIETAEQLLAVLDLFHKTDTEYFILGNGSNLLVGDKGYQGIIIQIASKMSKIEVMGTTIIAQAGAKLSQVAGEACTHHLAGLEFAAGIPGTIGGAVVMNAGAFEGEMQQIVTSVKVISPDGELLELDNATMEFAYRSSVIRNRKFTVIEVTMQLHESNEEEIRAKMKELTARRLDKQPLEYPSAGSTFKRPQGYYAGQLIMDAGMRGFRVGGAQVSEKHCGFIVNLGDATAEDIMEVIHTVQERVFDKFGVNLELEVIPLGEF